MKGLIKRDREAQSQSRTKRWRLRSWIGVERKAPMDPLAGQRKEPNGTVAAQRKLNNLDREGGETKSNMTAHPIPVKLHWHSVLFARF
jgi:hypothetical protein